jgi:transposase
VYAFHDRWSARDPPQRLSHRLRHRLSESAGRHQQPTAAIVDSHTFTRLKAIWVDAGYDGAGIKDWVKAVAAITLEVIARPQASQVKVIRRQWAVERSLGWLMRHRRLYRNYESLPQHQEAMIWWTNTIMTRRIGCTLNPSEPQTYKPRWGQPRSSNPVVGRPM